MADTADIGRGLFELVEIDRIAERVVEQIEQLIIAGVLRPGQKLPPERELAEAMGISRPKLREAFQTLAERGLVEIRRSEGAFIQPLAGPQLSPALVDLFARHRGVFLDFLEFRREQESFAAHLAAERATEADHEMLGQLVAELESARREDDRTREAELDRRFHMRVVEAAHNALLVHVMESIYALMSRSAFFDRGFLYEGAKAAEELLEQHREIAAAVLAREPDRASAAAEAHIDHVAQAFRSAEDIARRSAVARKRRTLEAQGGRGAARGR